VDSVARAETAARSDVYGLVELNVINTKPKSETVPQPLKIDSEQPGKEILLVMVGSPSYVLTADQSRFFTGSKLPTGHRIEEIMKNKVVLNKDGVRTELLM